MPCKLPACMPTEGPDWKCWPIGKWIDCMSIAAIVLGVLGGGIFVWTTDFGGIGAFCTLVVGITALVNKCAGFHNACCYKVLWIIEIVAAIVSSVLFVAAFVYILAHNLYWCNRIYWDDDYKNYCRSIVFVGIAFLFLFGIPFIIFQFIYAYILFRAEKLQQGRDGQEFP